MSASAEPQDRDPVAEAAQSAFASANGDVREATRRLEEAVRADRRLRDELTEPLIAEACYAAVRKQCRVTRRTVWRTSRRDLSRRHAEGARRILRYAESLMAFPLLGGRRLADARHDEIAAAAEFYAAQAGDMTVKARWLSLVAQRTPRGRTVGEALTEAQLRELREAASHG